MLHSGDGARSFSHADANRQVFESLIYLFTPFVLPISFLVRPSFCGYLLAATIVLYFVNVLIFNELHLRLRKERVAWSVIIFYYVSCTPPLHHGPPLRRSRCRTNWCLH